MKKFFASTKGKIITIVAGVLVIAAAVVIFILLNSSRDGYRSISISEIYGNVTAQNAGKEYKAYKNMKLADGYALTTDLDSYTRMLLDDDKYVKLEQQSHLLFESVGSKRKHLTTLRLERGAMVTEITRPLAEDEDYVINTPNAVLAVRGTYFRTEVMFDTNGDAYTYVYTYGGAVACRRVFPDGSIANEDVVVRAGYKACIKMDEIITVYLEEALDEISDNVDPIEYDLITDEDLVGIYNASMNGHTMFDTNEGLWNEIQARGVDINEYKSVYDGGDIPPYNEEAPSDDENNGSGDSSGSGSGNSDDTSNPDNSDDSSESDNSDDNSKPDNSDDNSEPDNSGSTSEPGDSGSTSEPGDSGSTSNPGNSGSTSNPGNSGSTSEPNNSGSTSEPDNSGSTSEPDNSGSTSEPDNSGDTSAPDNSGDTSEPDNSGDTSEPEKPNNTPPSSPRPGSFASSSGGGSSGSGSSSHTHAFGTYHSDNNATCLADGTKTAVCGCGVKNTIPDVGSKLPHTRAERTTPPTADSNGSKVVYCSVCGEILEDEVIPRPGYLYTDNGTITITETGYRQGDAAEETAFTGDYEITQHVRDTNLPYDIIVESGSHDITLDGVNISRFNVGGAAAIAALNGRERINVFSASDGITNYGSISIIGGSFIINNYGGGIINGGTFVITGGSVKANVIENTGSNAITNGVDEVVCHVLNSYPSDTSRFNITRSDGSGYTYNLSPDDVSDDGKYYVWLPELPELPDSVVIGLKHFPDPVFRDYISDNFDKNGDGYLSEAEIEEITEINVAGTAYVDGGITSLIGIELFTKLHTLRCEYNSGLSYLDVSRNTALSVLNCSRTQLLSLIVTQNTALTQLYCYGTPMTWLDLSNNAALTYLDCSVTQIGSLNVTNNTALTYLSCRGTPIKALDVSRNTALELLYCDDTSITSLDLSQNVSLTQLYCSNTPITSLDLSNNSALNILYCDNCRLPFIDLSDNHSLGIVSKLNNIYPLPASVTTMFDISTDSSFDSFDPYRASGVQNAVLDQRNGIFSNITGDITYMYDCGRGYFETFTLKLTGAFEEPDGVEITADNFPDLIFMQYVKDNFDTDNDGRLSDEEIEAVTKIDVSGTMSSDGGITSLEGIEIFTELQTLRCEYNEGLASLDVSGNAKLSYLTCAFTKIDALNVDNNTGLTVLYCSFTPITSINVRNNMALEQLHCDNTYITALDVRNNAALTHLYCYNTLITSLDVSLNTRLHTLQCQNCHMPFVDISNNNALGSAGYAFMAGNRYSLAEDITTVFYTGTDAAFAGFNYGRVTGVTGASFNGGIFKGFTGDTITYIYECGQGYSETFTLVRSGELDGIYIAVNEENFPDKKFREYAGQFDKDYDEALSEAEIAEVKTISVGGNEFTDGGITSLKGIEFFTLLNQLTCYYNSQLTALDVSGNTVLTYLAFNNTQITSVNLNENAELTILMCDNTPIGSLNLEANPALQYLSCGETSISELDVHNNTALEVLSCSNTSITCLDVSNNPDLTNLYCSDTLITSLDVSRNTKLHTLQCQNCHMPFVDISNNAQITDFSASGNIYPLPAGVTTVFYTYYDPNFDGFDPSMVSSDVVGASFEDGVFSNFTDDTIIYWYNCGQGRYVKFTLTLADELDGLEISEYNFPDPVFRNYISENFDADNNGFLSAEEIVEITEINVAGAAPYSDGGITSLKGIEHFTRLSSLYCGNNSGLTSFDVSLNAELTRLECQNTQITSLDVDKNIALNYLDCSNTPITRLDVSKNTALLFLWCDGCHLPFIDISNNSQIMSHPASHNTYTLPEGVGAVFDTRTDPNFNGFDYTKVSGVYGATFSDGVFSYFIGDTITYSYNCGNGYADVFTLRRYDNPSLLVDLQIIPDEVFRQYLKDNFDTNSDGFLSQSECDLITEINVSGLGIRDINAPVLFDTLKNLETIDLSNNPEMSSAPALHTCEKLRTVNLNNANQYGVFSLPETLEKLIISNNPIERNIHDLPSGLKYLDISNTFTLDLNISNLTELTTLYCYDTPIMGVLNTTNNTALEILDCHNTSIEWLHLSQNTALRELNCSNTRLPSVDVSDCPNITSFKADNCKYIAVGSIIYAKDMGYELHYWTVMGFDPERVSNVQNADISKDEFGESKFINITDEVTYTYNCGQGHYAEFTLSWLDMTT